MKLHDIVRLKEDDLKHGVKKEHDGVIVDVCAPGVFTIEFFDDEGFTIMPALMNASYFAEQLILVEAYSKLDADTKQDE